MFRPRARSFLVLSSLAMAAMSATATATTWYVDDNTCPSVGNGTQGSPFCSLQKGIDTAVNGDEVHALPGTYGIIDFKGKAITVKSTQGRDVTFITATNAAVKVEFKSDEGNGSIVEGFTIHGGTGPGIQIYEAAPIIRNCKIANNVGDAGILCQGCGGDGGPAALIEDSIVCNNSSANGGIHIASIVENVILQSEVRISGCRIEENDNGGVTATDPGNFGGGGTIAIERTIIASNRRSDIGGGGVYTPPISVFEFGVGAESVDWVDLCADGDPNTCRAIWDVVITNSLIFGNTAESGGGIELGYCTRGVIKNTTVTGNYANGTVIDTGRNEGAGGGLAVGASCTNTIVNSIFWGNFANTSSGQEIAMAVGAINMSYSDLRGGPSGVRYTIPFNGSPLNWGTGNITADPEFCDPYDWDFHLATGSPCINAGSNASATGQYDLDGNARIYATTVDMGAYEHQGTGCAGLGLDAACANCPSASIVAANPPDGTRDARQPHPMNDNSLFKRQGIGSKNLFAGYSGEPIYITLSGSATGADSPGCWRLCETGIEPVDEGPPLSPNRILEINTDQSLPGLYAIYLARPISSQHWTTLTYLGGGDEVSYASMPGDANHNGYTLNADVLLVNAWVQDGCAGHTVYEWDIDRNGLCQTADAQQINYLMTGTDKFVVWHAKQLSSNTCASESLMGGQSEDVAFDSWEVVDTFVGLILDGGSGWIESETDLENLSEAFLDWAYGHLADEERLSAADYIEESAALTDDEFVIEALTATADALRE